ncbi:hypothetical protein [Pedobacter frigidisoli]|uniref:hypothetical protein n=1 Tax=Pedobacter frigidisoli TaxID=2530455 RepID=UPI00292F9236|nr:hypothetical protein [Pedobacter frigidisoli]
MNNEIKLPPDCLGFYCIPLDEESCSLSLEVLNQHSEFRDCKDPFLLFFVRHKGFDYSLVKLTVEIEQEKKPKLVYLAIKDRRMYVTCNSGTNSSFLSRHAYFAVYDTMSYCDPKPFGEYDWYDFFEAGKKKSKYLNVICDRRGLTIDLRKKYKKFWKKGDRLFEFRASDEKSERKPELPVNLNKTGDSEQLILGYLCCTSNWWGACVHLPILVPYRGQLNKARTNVHMFIKMLGPEDVEESSLTEEQKNLNAICLQMEEIAWLADRKAWVNEITASPDEIKSKHRELFTLWHAAWPYLAVQRFLRLYYTVHKELLRMKPVKSEIRPLKISTARPQIFFILKDCGEYFELRLRVKIGKKIISIVHWYEDLFLSADDCYFEYYLFDSYQDLQLAKFFKSYSHRFSVLKTHYDGAFAAFVQKLRERYEFL